ncbi:hypothetical protein PENTCL1PPCAC_15294, partial [Pristionchus entomophagus]
NFKVVAVFLVIGESDESLVSITQKLNDVTYSGNITEIARIRLRYLLPSFTDAFYRYEGSLTTPLCNEAVQWLVLAEPSSMTRHQV